MPRLSLAQSEVVKRRLFRTREHIECCTPEALDPFIENFSLVTYEIARGLGLPAVRHESGASAREYRGDAAQNFAAVIDFDLTQLDIPCDPEDCVRAAQELMVAVHQIPLPSSPSPGTPL